MSTSVSLNTYFEQFIQRQIESGRFNNVSEVIRAGLRLLDDQESQTFRSLRNDVAEGLASGQALPAEKIFTRLEDKYKAISKK